MKNLHLKYLIENETKIIGDENIAVVGGRGSGSDTCFSTHVHLKIGHYDTSGNMIPIDMRHLLERTVDHITASDPGPDGLVQTYGDNATRTVVWDDDIRGWTPEVQDEALNEWIAYTRSEQLDAASLTPAYWTAWDEDPSARTRIIRTYNLQTNEYMWIRIKQDGTIDRPAPGKAWQWINRDWITIDFS